MICSTLLAVVLTSTNQAPTGRDFYESFVNAISVARGFGIVDMRQGYFSTNAGGNLVRWRVGPATEGTFEFDYSGGKVQTASLKFNKPVHVWLVGSTGISGGITELSYNNLGRIESWKIKWDNTTDPSTIDPNKLPQLLTNLELDRDVANAFLGAPLKSASKAQPLKENGQRIGSPINIFTRLQIIKRSATQPALEVQLDSDVPLRFFDQAKSRLALTVGGGSTVILDDSQYFVDTRYAEGSIQEIDLKVTDGQIETEGAKFKFSPGSEIKLRKVTFEHSRDRSLFESKFGSLTANLQLGSSIELAKSDNAPSLFLGFNDGTTISIGQFSILQDDKEGSRFEIHAGSARSSRLNVRSGRLDFGANNLVNIDSALLTLDKLSAVWGTSQKPYVSAVFDTGYVALGTGSYTFEPGSTVAIESGEFQSSDFSFDSGRNPRFRAKLEKALINFAPNTRLQMGPDGMTLGLDQGSMLSSDDLYISDRSSHLSGKVRLTAKLTEFRSSPTSIFSLSGGSIYLPLQISETGRVTTPFVESNGQIQYQNSDRFTILNAKFIAKGVPYTVAGVLNFRDGIIYVPTPSGAKVTATVGGRIDQFNADIPIPPGNEDVPNVSSEKWYPVVFNVSSGSRLIPETNFEFNGGSVIGSLDLSGDYTVTLPAATVFSGKVLLVSDVNLYTIASSHLLKLNANVQFGEGSGLGSLNILRVETPNGLNRGQAWDRDSDFLANILAGLLGSIVNPGLAIPAGVIGGDMANDKIDQLIQTAIYRQVHRPRQIRF